MQGWLSVIVAIAYVSALFIVASLGDRRASPADRKRSRPLTYALSLAIYCTSWTFFGSVGLATERGPEFLAIYTGPILVFLFGFPLLRRIIRLAKAEKITSVADFLGARYGKSFAVASIATLIATVGAIPYIALQLKAISGSVSLMVEHYGGAPPAPEMFLGDIAFPIAMLLALFAVLFGTRHADATEHQDGLVLAVAVESVVKLAAFIAVGVFALTLIGGSPAALLDAVTQPGRNASGGYQTSLSSWIVLTLLSACAILFLPRQFHVTVAENRSEAELRAAGWVFPLYLVAINLFVLPIAFVGLGLVGDRTSADLYVLALPLFGGYDALAFAAFVGGLSAATAMVIVESVALSIMISNDLVIPLFVRRLINPPTSDTEDWSKLILNVRRAAIFVILFAAFLYYRQASGAPRLASIGLMAFAAIAQFAPAFLGGLIWRGANARGAVLGMGGGFLVWGYTLLLPSLAAPDATLIRDGMFGLQSLRPQALFGTIAEPFNHGVLWSLGVNAVLFVLGSLSRAARPLERIQASIFVPREANPMPSLRRLRTAVTIDELKDTIARYLGVERTERAFETFAQEGGRRLAGNAAADPAAMRFSEQLLAGAVGSSSARLILSLLFQRKDSTREDALRLLDDASEALQYNRDLLQSALDQMEQGITVFDRDYRLTCWNRQYRSLFALPDELGQVGVRLSRFLDHLAQRGDLEPGADAAALDRLSEFGQPWSVTLKTSGRTVEILSNPMPGGGLVATYTDITARVEADLALKRANESLEQRVAARTAELTVVNAELAEAQLLAEEANLGKTRFLAAAGHDILQPLNAARLYCAALIEKAGQAPAGEAAARIDSALESVESILGAVLDISRLDAGAMKPTETTFRLDGLLQQIRNDFAPLAAEKRLRLIVVPSSLAVETDRNLMRRLVGNLVSNAIKYTRPGGRVLIGVRRRGALAEIQVADTGIGIAPDRLHTVFREFTRLDEAAREAEGLGLGLSIVDRIARVLRLELRIESQQHRGAQFSVLLPTASSPAAPVFASAQLAGPPPSFSPGGLVILAVDNDRRIVEGMRRLLEGWGCRLETAMGWDTLDLARLAAVPPDMVLADYHLDHEIGLDLIARLRTRFGEDLPAALITADRSTEVREAAEALGVAVLGKPVKPAALRSLISRTSRMLAAAE